MKRTVVFLFLAALLTIPAASAQSPSQQPSDRFRLTTGLPSFGPAANLISAQPDFPFSAVVVQRWEQTLSDGTHISKDTQETVMRDDAGRIYRGRTVEIPGRSRSE